MCSAMAGAQSLPTALQSNSAKTSLTCSFTRSVTSGDVLVAALSFFSGSTFSISDTRGSSYSLAASTTAGGLTTAVYIATAPSSGSNTVTFVASGSADQNTACAEYANVTATVDTSTTGGYSGTPGTITTGNITTSVGQDLLIGYVSGFRSSGILQTGTGYYPLAQTRGDDSSAMQAKIAGANGTYNATWTNANNDQGGYVLVALKPTSSIGIATTSLPSAIKNVAYTYTLLGAGGVGSYTWALASGTLPTGLSLNTSTGEISGTPTAGSGTNALTFRITDGSSNTTTKALTLLMGGSASTPTKVQAASSSRSNTVAFGSNVTTGNTVIVSTTSELVFSKTANFVPTDTQGTIYSLICRSAVWNSDGQVFAQYAGKLTSSGADTVTVTDSLGIVVGEYSGVQAFPDNCGETTGSGNGTFSSNNLTTLVPNELLYTGAFPFSQTTTIAVNSPFTSDGSVTGASADGYNLATSVTTYSSSITFGVSSTNWGIQLFGFRPDIPSVLPPAGTKRRQAQVY